MCISADYIFTRISKSRISQTLASEIPSEKVLSLLPIEGIN